jgi:hypothetical protein
MFDEMHCIAGIARACERAAEREGTNLPGGDPAARQILRGRDLLQQPTLIPEALGGPPLLTGESGPHKGRLRAWIQPVVDLSP